LEKFKKAIQIMKQQKAIILGGTSGIGEAVARALHEKGIGVIAASRRESDSKDYPVEQVDVLDREGLENLFQRHAPFDFLVNAATGGPRAGGPFLQMDLDDFQNSFAKLWGYTNSVRLAAEHMSEDGAITLISGYPARKSTPGMSAISTVGNAVEGFVRAVAVEISPLRINAVSPGVIDTPMFLHADEARVNFLSESTSSNIIQRAGLPSEVAEAVIFQLFNKFVTGTTIDVDGGALLP
jgi:NAD(P)-dependent dehydrogenase (short-subunit alcohol dehydrogenase family)